MMTKKVLTLAIVGLMSVSFTACKCFQSDKNNTTTMTKDFDLQGSEWKLASIAGKKFVKPAQMRNDEISLKFDEGFVATSDGCNGMSGEYTQNGENLSFGLFRATKMFCDWETFNVPFNEVKSFRTNGKQLELINDSKDVVATYTKK